MPYLALDTSTEYLSLAINTARGIVARDWPAEQKHAEMILPALATLLQECQLSMKDIEGVAFGNGPGSFTGLRIAAGITQGLAFARNIPVLGVSTLAALAEGCHARQVYVCLDARMNQVYCAAYRKEADVWQTIIEPCLSDPDSIPLPDDNNWLGTGSGFAAYGETLKQRLGTQLNGTNTEHFPHAKDILTLALPGFAAGKGSPAAQAELVYLRNKVALKTHERIKK
ncbi:tRNA (adenosine(37)-N6)-threonylcarbamoyltransferase complex dimerization subunit type 1 TsaB [Iodobacter ciconiae]|uniref:tRNA (Adenosine(37)-N6)-threonylcarbamoyltransferase complex dimerization subunit type 1 TsaB n=1 Tax=Iodobacter ciconiae TaxID=2496266 RepID=A0A3S8ZPA6_9NEIS|nr:tRNA (adenosine(37)-N6)-threonylcarbamoyltransferase complex dimerization subunit type 1 TsaB [Iodobacter ciconiae]AZN35302.1 tRNA (adenosine(37)-N6)-threonylcarbamoyltransferase complex dimerization subunit type 1 TsaB [Iodobacter ciconiae]